MTDGLLENIIRLEKQIQAEVAEEEQRAHAWQDRELELLDAALLEAEAREDERRKEALAAQQTSLQHEVDTLEREAAAWCERLAKLDETRLRAALKEQLADILPGENHDHPHGQG